MLLTLHVGPFVGRSLSAQQASPALLSIDRAQTALYARVRRAVVAFEVKSFKPGSRRGRALRRRHPFGGTAFFVDPGGYLLTAAALVEDAGRIRLRLPDGRESSAGVVATAPAAGVALLRMVPPPRDPMPTLPLGDSTRLRVGEPAYTLTNAFGTQRLTGQSAFSRGTITGIYSVYGAGDYHGEVLETDAAVNPGGFGGPLLNGRGEAVGVLVPAFSFNRWLGTAVPSHLVRPLLAQLRARKTPPPGDVGFACEERLVIRRRARVTRVDPEGPAAKAGLKVGDEILAFGGARLDTDLPAGRGRLRDFGAFLRALETLPAGAEVSLLVLRPGRDGDTLKRITFEAGPYKPRPPAAKRGTLGLRFDEDDTDTEVTVVWVDPKGPAGEAGIRPGDVLLRIEGRRVVTRKRALELLKRHRRGEAVRLRFSREGWERDFRLVLKPLRRL